MVMHGTMFRGGGCKICGLDLSTKISAVDDLEVHQIGEATVVLKPAHHHKNLTVEECESIAKWSEEHPEYARSAEYPGVEHAHAVFELLADAKPFLEAQDDAPTRVVDGEPVLEIKEEQLDPVVSVPSDAEHPQMYKTFADRIIQLRSALRFYATEDNYNEDGAPYTEVYVAHGGECEQLDLGDRAREALKDDDGLGTTSRG